MYAYHGSMFKYDKKLWKKTATNIAVYVNFLNFSDILSFTSSQSKIFIKIRLLFDNKMIVSIFQLYKNALRLCDIINDGNNQIYI